MDKKVYDYLEHLNQIYYAFIALPLVLYPMIYLPIKDSTLSKGEALPELVYYGLGLVLFIDLFFGWFLYKRRLRSIDKEWELGKKLKAHRNAALLFYTFGLVASLISVGLLWLTRHQLFVGTYPVLLLIISFYRPTVGRLKRELPLTDKELTMIKNKGEKTKNIG